MSLLKRVTFKGTLGNGEIWMCGYAVETEESPSGLATLAKESAESRLSGNWGDTVTWNSVRVDEFNESDGVIIATEETPFTDFPQGGGGNNLPPEVAVVVTIRTLQAGLTGRFYLPAPTTAACGPGGRLTDTWRDSMATNFFTMFQNDYGTNTPPVRLGVYSRAQHTFVGASGIDIGNVFDAQRRRRNRLIEVRASHNIA